MSFDVFTEDPSPPETPGVSSVIATARRRRDQRRALGSLAVVVVMLCSAFGLRYKNEDRSVVANDTAAPRVVDFNGVTFALPDGWKTAPPSCRPADNTLTVGTYGGSCPSSGPLSPVTSVNLSPIFGPQLFGQGTGTPIAWTDGEPGLFHETTEGDQHFATLYLPRRNVAIAAASPDRATARDLALRGPRPRVVDVEGSLDNVDRVVIESGAGTDGDGLPHSITLGGPDAVDPLVAELRALPRLDPTTPLCHSPTSPMSATITVTKGELIRTFLARFDDCAQTTSGSGDLLRTTDALRDRVARLVPNSGLEAPDATLPGTPNCVSPPLEQWSVRPATIFLGCATSADYLADITWNTWTSTSATGTATRNIDECRRPDPPDCGAGPRYSQFPVNVTLSNPGKIDARFVFRTITLLPTAPEEAAEATTVFCGKPDQNFCTAPAASWGYVPNQS